MPLTYQQRKERGQQQRWKYRNRMNHAEHLATMLRGISLGSAFCSVMFWVAGIDTTLDVLLEIGAVAICGISFVEAEHILFLAEQSRYPKSRRRTLRSELADDWAEFRDFLEKKKKS